ncbi:MAG TPA: acyl-CoA thioesterase domain-containing protein, partial [Candidatus Elarobacter sp.]
MRTIAGHTDRAYWNMNGPFGGWIASQLLGAVLDDPDRRGEPIATGTSFVGPIAEGAFTIETRTLRVNRSTDFRWAELRQTQDGTEAICAYATVALAQRPQTTT